MTPSVCARGVAQVLALLIVLASASEAWAHASLVKAEPADGAVLPAPPAALTLTFNEPVSPLVMRLIGPTGVPVAPRSVVADNTTVTISGLPALAPGTHVLSWRVSSADGHPVGGSLMFSIGAPSGQPAAGADQTADPGVRASLWAAKLAIYLGLFVGVGGAFFRAWIAVSPSGAARILVTVLVAGLIATPISVGVQGLDALGLPLADLTQEAAWEAGLATSYGRTAIAAAGALFAGLFTFAASSTRVARGLALSGLLGTGLALALSGHASTAEPRLLSAPAVFLHGVCVAFWIGALLPLYACMRAAPSPAPELQRFSRVIPLPLAVLVATGLWLAIVQLGGVDALWTTRYGNVLALKLAAVVALLGLAAANRYRWVPRFEAAGQKNGSAAAARPLAMSIAFELVIALAILALVALWRFTPPPRALAVAAPISIHVHGAKAMAQIEIERPGRRSAGASVLVLDGEFRPLAVKEVTLVLANPAAGIEPMRRVATAAGESVWRIDDLRVPVAGRWSLRIELLITDFDKLTLEDTVALPRLP